MVAANRDEMLTRPAEGFARRDDDVGPNAGLGVLAPRDLLSGGTWLGLNANGLFVGITNRAGLAPDPDRRSRGLLVNDALGHADARAAAESSGAVDPHAYNPFHLVMADREEAWLAWSDGKKVRREQLGPGVHVITERSFGAAPTLRPGKVSGMLDAVRDGPYPGAAWFQRLLARTDPDAPLEGVCIHFADGPGGEPYGTRSSTILELRARDGDPPSCLLLDHQGPPRVLEGGEPDEGWVDLSTDALALLAGR